MLRYRPNPRRHSEHPYSSTEKEHLNKSIELILEQLRAMNQKKFAVINYDILVRGWIFTDEINGYHFAPMQIYPITWGQAQHNVATQILETNDPKFLRLTNIAFIVLFTQRETEVRN